jgi:hypothetical protein
MGWSDRRTTPTRRGLRLLESQLQPRGVPFSRAALIAFVKSAWPWIEEKLDVELWAAKFLATDAVTTPT